VLDQRGQLGADPAGAVVQELGQPVGEGAAAAQQPPCGLPSAPQREQTMDRVNPAQAVQIAALSSGRRPGSARACPQPGQPRSPDSAEDPPPLIAEGHTCSDCAVLVQALDHAVALSSAQSGDFYTTLGGHIVDPARRGAAAAWSVLAATAVTAFALLVTGSMLLGTRHRGWWWAAVTTVALGVVAQAADVVVLGGAYHRSTGLVLPAAALACLLLPRALPASGPAPSPAR
jgi:hypothetical protein